MDNIGANFKKKLSSKSPIKTASMLRRAGSLLIDIIIINIIIMPPFRKMITSFVGNSNILEIQVVPSHIYTAVFMIAFLSLLYFTLFQYYFQQTIGMMALKIKVTPAPGFFRAVLRNIYILPFFPFNLLWIIEPLYLYFKGTRLLEKLSGTSTVQK